jgi:hypothetical protein
MYSEQLIIDCLNLNCNFMGFESPKNYKKNYEIIAFTAIKAKVHTNAVYLARYNTQKYNDEISRILNNKCIKEQNNKIKTAFIAYSTLDFNIKSNIDECKIFKYNELEEYIFIAYEID